MSGVVVAVLLGVVEGLTEFVPVSSTGHLILASRLLGEADQEADLFVVVVQLGAILAVAWLYRTRLRLLFAPARPGQLAGPRGLTLLAFTTLPAALLGALAHEVIAEHLFRPVTVAVGLAVGGLVMLAVERLHPRVNTQTVDGIGLRTALLIGLAQCAALWPGVSRSAATIVGAMAAGVERRAAAEYSFLAAIPLLAAAVLFDLARGVAILEAGDAPRFAIGFVVAFLAALVAVRSFLHLLAAWSLRPFAWYRLALAAVVLAATVR
jgi:undecaprenyl-diphosphatase